MASNATRGKAMAVVSKKKPGKAAPSGPQAKAIAVARAKAMTAAKGKRAKMAPKIPPVTMSLAETIRLPYRPTSFKLKDMRRIVANVKRTQG